MDCPETKTTYRIALVAYTNVVEDLMKFELLVIRCLLALVEAIGKKSLNDVEDELIEYKRNLKQQQSFEDTH